MSRLSFERYCAEIIAQTDLLATSIKDADMSVPVPSCPGWNVGQLVRHLGGGQRWVETIARTRATEPPSDTNFRDLSACANEDPEALVPWLVECGAGLEEALREIGPDAEVWTPLPGHRSRFFARRFAHETLVHRADAELALGIEFTAATDVLLDAVDEWLELLALPQMFEFHPGMRELLGPGRTLHFHATDTPEEAGAEWVVDLTGELIQWRSAHEKAAVAVRAPLADLLLVLYRRRPARSAGVEVIGDAELLDFWLERVGFG
ncbi:maleylpyruvate isomerase family mycothiol-dependent enzyme [Allokutzneria oryzae]|uniref:Maleylpyruvate isomerase family mycothiol-dependent enzyme n=1 Tax=Allokutzneria oryzae TaxID=1378989 RepID=A0ABV6A924_9PSEU